MISTFTVEVIFNLSPGVIRTLIRLPSVREHEVRREGFRSKMFSKS